ncbi:MAG: GntR family transcriptional regulator [Actinobacteria bacterium]|nr:MAG: GntR family transcriptional regulator [Actinomycetota bacterium]
MSASLAVSRSLSAGGASAPSRLTSDPCDSKAEVLSVQSPEERVILPQPLIDRDSPVPFYFQLSELLEHEILSGRWKAGLRLPSELDLCEHFGVSRTTVRQALARLEQEGLISRRKGHGTFVQESRPRSWLLQSSAGFFQEEETRTGRRVSSQVRRAERCVLPAWASDALGFEPESRGVTIDRVRSVDGLVAMYNVNYLPERFADTVLSVKGDESLYERLREEHSVEPAGGRRVLESVPAGDLLANLLGVQPQSPLVFIESVTWDRTMEPFDCYQTWLRTDRMKIDIEVMAAPANAAAAADRIHAAAPVMTVE